MKDRKIKFLKAPNRRGGERVMVGKLTPSTANSRGEMGERSPGSEVWTLWPEEQSFVV